MKEPMKEILYWLTLLLAAVILFSCISCQVEPKTTKLVITEPVVIECTGPVTYSFKRVPVLGTWWWSQYISPWLLPSAPPVQYHCYNTKGEKAMMPRALKASIDLYVDRGVPVGGFVYAVLSNNLFEVFSRAEEHYRANLETICDYIQNYTPAICYGSEERVTKWLELHRNLPKSACILSRQDRERRELYYKPETEEIDE